jgi:hypothetical protein
VANFLRHLEIGTLASGVLSTASLGSGLITPEEAIVLWITGSLGGILPDIDSDTASALDIVFNIITLCFIIATFYLLHTNYPTLLLWGVSIFIYGVMKLLARPMFEAVTAHRGIFHSIASGLFFAFTAVNIAFYLGKQSELLSWLIGSFLLFGYITHLFLDELYSVDFANTRIKRSFGSALKLFDYKNIKISALMLVAVIICYNFTPKSTIFIQTVTSRQTFDRVKESFFPSWKDLSIDSLIPKHNSR